MKTTLSGLLLTLSVLSTLSCGTNPPDSCYPAIEDSVKGIITMASFEMTENVSMTSAGINIATSLLADMGFPAVKEIHTALKEDGLYEKVSSLTESSVSYRDAFLLLCRDSNETIAKGAGALLDYYDGLDPTISGYTLTKNSLIAKEWRFSETNSGIVFYFGLTDLDKPDHKWYCRAGRESLERYMKGTLKKVIDNGQVSLVDKIVENVIDKMSQGDQVLRVAL